MEPVYRHFPWKALLKTGTEGVATTDYGRRLMHSIMMTYDAGHNSNTDAPEEVNRLIEDFAAQIRTSPREQGTVRVNDIDLYYEKRGCGQPLIMVHGNGEDHGSYIIHQTRIAELILAFTE